MSDDPLFTRAKKYAVDSWLWEHDGRTFVAESGGERRKIKAEILFLTNSRGKLKS
jgi:hypothetical protein